MIALPFRSFIVAASLATATFALPAAAETTANPDVTATTGAAAAEAATFAADVPSPRARPASLVRKRIASTRPHVRRVVRPAPYWVYPYERVAVHWPILFIGVGF